MKKYQTSLFNLKIEEVECTKETDKTVTIVHVPFHKKEKPYERLHKKNSESENFHDTFFDAKEYLIRREKETLASLIKDVEDQRNALRKVEAITGCEK